MYPICPTRGTPIKSHPPLYSMKKINSKPIRVEGMTGFSSHYRAMECPILGKCAKYQKLKYSHYATHFVSKLLRTITFKQKL